MVMYVKRMTKLVAGIQDEVLLRRSRLVPQFVSTSLQTSQLKHNYVNHSLVLNWNRTSLSELAFYPDLSTVTHDCSSLIDVSSTKFSLNATPPTSWANLRAVCTCIQP